MTLVVLTAIWAVWTAQVRLALVEESSRTWTGGATKSK